MMQEQNELLPDNSLDELKYNEIGGVGFLGVVPQNEKTENWKVSV